MLESTADLCPQCYEFWFVAVPPVPPIPHTMELVLWWNLAPIDTVISAPAATDLRDRFVDDDPFISA